MNKLQKIGEELFNYDSLTEAEKLTGLSYKECESAVAAGLMLHMDNSEKKKAFAAITKDTHFSMSVVDYIAVVDDVGFKQIFHKNFEAEHCGELRKSEHFVYWHAGKGILLTFDTYIGGRVNSGKFYFNARFEHPSRACLTHCSGRFVFDNENDFTKNGIWVGDFDCREGSRHRISMIETDGEFLPVWKERPFLWLLTWADTIGDYDYNEINQKVIAQFPQDVQNAIKGE